MSEHVDAAVEEVRVADRTRQRAPEWGDPHKQIGFLWQVTGGLIAAVNHLAAAVERLERERGA